MVQVPVVLGRISLCAVGPTAPRNVVAILSALSERSMLGWDKFELKVNELEGLSRSHKCDLAGP
jgi:hypothetical protein